MKQFGILPDGKKINEYTIENKWGMKLSAINYGGIITKLLVPDKTQTLRNVVLGYDSLKAYLHDSFYVGAIVGRCANRICNATCTIEGIEYKLSENLAPNHSHHGGKNGFHTAFWNITKEHTTEGETLLLQYTSKAGESGYPGTMQVQVRYTLSNENALIIEYSAKTDATTIANFTQHSYFNISENRNQDVHKHLLQVFADEFLAVHPDGIPTGEIVSVKNTALDLHQPTSILHILESNDEHITTAGGLDNCFVFKKENSNELLPMAKLHSADSGITLEVSSTQVGLQCYSSNFLETPFIKHQAICLETQGFTNAVNEPSFPSVLLHPNESYNEKTVFKFGFEK